MLLNSMQSGFNPGNTNYNKRIDKGLARTKPDSNISIPRDKPLYYELLVVLGAKVMDGNFKGAFKQLVGYTRQMFQKQHTLRFAWGLTVSGRNVRVCHFGSDKATSSCPMSVSSLDGRRAFVETLVNWSFCEQSQLGRDPTIAYLPELECWEIACPDDTGSADDRTRTTSYYFKVVSCHADRPDLQLLYFTYRPKDIYPDVAIALYLLATVVLIVQIVRQKAQFWLYILPATAFAEALGYVFRELCVHKTTFTLYVLMTLFLLLPPNAMALVNYKTVGKIIEQSPARSRSFFLRSRFVNWFYFTSDILSIALQGAGGGLMTSRTNREHGKKIVLVGLAIQLFFFACFLVTSFYVWARSSYSVAMSSSDSSPLWAKRKVLFTVVATTVLLYLRSIYRIIEFADGYGGTIYSAEWAFYAFDTLIIYLAFIVYMAVPLGSHFVRAKTMPTEGAEEAAPLQFPMEPKNY